MSAVANKFDGGKLPMHLNPPEAEEALATVLGPGAKKYGERNWEQGGLSWDRLYGAMRRHLGPAHLWMSTGGEHGEWIDKDTGVPHIFCAFAELAFAVTYVQRGMIEVPQAAERAQPPEKVFYLRDRSEIERRRYPKGGYPSAWYDDLPDTVSSSADVVCHHSDFGNPEVFHDYYEEVK